MFAANNFFPDTCLQANDTHHTLKRRREQSAKRIALKRLANAKPKAIHRQYDTQVTNCIFLDENRIVVSFDNRGYVSFIRCNAYHEEPLASIPAIPQSRMWCRGDTPALFSVDNGNALVAGFGSGELRVFATESSSTILSSKALEPSKSTATTTYLGRTLRSWVARRPLRRYEVVPAFPLRSQLCDPYRYVLDTTDEIRDWSNNNNNTVATPQQQPGAWDVREVPSLQAVHVGPHKDMFAVLRIMDERSLGQHHIAIDLDRGGEYCDVCFVSDYMLASSERNGTVKLWDMRRLQSTPRQTVASFPKDNAHGVSALHSFHCSGAAKLVMLGTGKLLAVSDSTTSMLDPFRRKLETTVKNYNKNDDHTIMAIDKKYGLVARAGIGDTVELREALPHLVRSRKRKVDPVDDTTVSVDAMLEDSYGCTTQMNCLAFSPSGSRLVCGTADGDVYVW